MSLESLIDSALKEGAGISLRKVKRSARYKKRLKRKKELPKRFGPKTHRGIALRQRASIFGGLLNINLHNERTVFSVLKGVSGKASDKHLRDTALIEELGERLIDAAVTKLSPEAREMAAEFSKSKDVELQISLLGGLRNMINLTASRRSKQDKKKNGPSLPVGYEWVDMFFKQQSPSEFLPMRFDELGATKMPNCLGLSILLSAWATAAGARFLYATEIVNYRREEYRFLLAMYKALLALLDGLGGKDAKTARKALRKDMKHIRGWQVFTRDWHHGIAIELMDGRWFFLDPYTSHAQVFPDQWSMQDIGQKLKKYEEVLPGLSLIAHDHGVQRKNLEVMLETLLDYVAKAEAAKYKLSLDPGDNCTLGDYLAIAPELELLTELLVENNPEWQRPTLAPYNLLGWILVIWEHRNGKNVVRPKEEALKDLARMQTDAKFRRHKLDSLIVEFCRHAETRVNSIRGHQIHPVLEFGNPAYTIALNVLSNLSSWTEDRVPGTLLLEHGNSQMLWHEAVSPIPKLASLSLRAKKLIKLGYHIASMVPQHDRTKLKMPAMSGLIKKIGQEMADKEKEE